MANQKQKEKKKKQREKEVKEKLAHRRQMILTERKKVQEQQLRELEAEEIIHGKPKPFRRLVNVTEDEAAKRARVTSQLERNLKLLEALEREYDEEQAAREQVNEDLESQGHMTMKEKMDALHQKALELTGNAQPLAEATAEYEKEKEIEKS